MSFVFISGDLTLLYDYFHTFTNQRLLLLMIVNRCLLKGCHHQGSKQSGWSLYAKLAWRWWHRCLVVIIWKLFHPFAWLVWQARSQKTEFYKKFLLFGEKLRLCLRAKRQNRKLSVDSRSGTLGLSRKKRDFEGCWRKRWPRFRWPAHNNSQQHATRFSNGRNM